MTVKEFVQVKLRRFGIEMDDLELEALFLEAGSDGNIDYSPDVDKDAKRAIITAIPELLMSASEEEGGYAVSRNHDSIMAYYTMLCNELGMENKLLTRIPKIRNKSDMW